MRYIYQSICLWSCLLLFNHSLSAQALQTSWISTIGGSQFEENNSLAQAPCGDIYTVGFFQEQFGPLSTFGQDREDGFITKYNDQGVLQWVQQLRGTSTDRINGIAITDDNSIYIVGEFRNKLYYNTDSLVSKGRLDIFVAKLDSTGQFLWAFNAGSTQDDSAHDIDVLSNGNLVLTGYFQIELSWGMDTLQTNTSRDVFVGCVQPDGSPLWASVMSGPAVDESNSIATDSSNCLYIMGSFRDFLYPNGAIVRSEGGVDAFLAKYDSTGQLLWAEVMGGPAGDQGRYVTVDADQNVIAGGWISSYLSIPSTLTFIVGDREEDAFAVKYDPAGNLIWAKIIGGTFDERIYAIETDENSDIYFMGTLDSLLVINGDSLRNRHLNRPTDIFIIKYDSTGNYKWGQTLGHYYNDFCYDLIVPNSQALYIAGSYQDTSIFVNDTLISAFGYDIFVAKFSMDTSLHIPLLSPTVPSLPASLFPNPSSDQSVLTVELEQASALHIVICDALGRIVHQQKTAFLGHGEHQILLSKQDWASGTYFVTVQSATKARVLPWVLK
ncbi:MAG: T9SS type A sorting domain-containing protein [Aureispira sp.]